MKKFFIFLSTSLIALSLVSCGQPKTYTVVWQNYDNSVLDTDEKVKKGEMPQYDGATPTRETDETYVYEFAGWSPELTAVSENSVYVATFTRTPHYRVTFLDYDNSPLYETRVVEGNVPQYVGEDPTREEDDWFSYSFNGWSPELSAISQETTYIATYLSTPLPTYHVTFVNYDDSVLYETDVVKRHEAVFEGETPTKPEDDEFTYEFDGWDQDLSHIFSDITAKAKYKYTAKSQWGPIHF